MSAASQGLEEAAQLLDGRSPVEVRTICIEALRRWHRHSPSERLATMHGALGLYVAQLMVDEGKAAIDPNLAKEAFLYRQAAPELAPVMEFVAWLERAGLARPRYFIRGVATQTAGAGGYGGMQWTISGSAEVESLYLTDSGLRLLELEDDHPLSPGYLARLRTRHTDLPDEVVAVVSDAQACLEFRLLRPSIVLLGVAYEMAIFNVLHKLAERAIGPGTKKVDHMNAVERIAELRKLVPLLVYSNEDRALATAAVDFADHLRDRRNGALHPIESWPFDDTGEAEEWALSAARHLPIVWDIASRELRPRAA